MVNFFDAPDNLHYDVCSNRIKIFEPRFNMLIKTKVTEISDTIRSKFFKINFLKNIICLVRFLNKKIDCISLIV
jgi:hypothetical protein